MKRRLFFSLLCFFAAYQSAFADLDNSVRRFGLFVGANNGGGSRTTLRYAVSDARSISGVFSMMGGIQDADHTLLIDPSGRDIEQNLDALRNRILEAKRNFQRTELVFYYSGHSDEEGLLLGRQKYRYRDLRDHINSLPVDMRIVILDSCASGAFTRLKGGSMTASFLSNDSVSVEGYAFLTSSSAVESSQESDSIAGSYFTHSLLSGLRGAADAEGDGRVTLNELYNFAYRETLAKTETSLYGAQHPSYDMQISGTGEVVLTDVKETSAGLVLEADVTGRITIRDRSDFLVVELTKVQNKALEIGLEPGSYRIVLQQGNRFYRAEVRLARDQRGSLSLKKFSPIAPNSAVSRGDLYDPLSEEEDGEAYPVEPFKLQVIPDIWMGQKAAATAHYFLFGLIGADGWDLRGLGIAPIGISNYGEVTGVQLGGLYATAWGAVRGIQGAWLFTYAGGNVQGIQGAGIFTYAGGNVQGIQGAGIFTYAGGNVRGIQGAGIFDYVGGNVQGLQGAGIFTYARGNVRGIQGAGIFDYAGGNVQGLQGAGIFTYAGGNVRGIQGAGLFNVTRGGMQGVQAAGIYNLIGGAFSGLQAGLVNASGAGSSGVQIGLVNISKSDTVLPIGLVNIIKGGILNPSIWVDSMGFMNLSFKSGSKHFYTHISAGLRQIPLGDTKLTIMDQDDENVFVFRSGLGAEIPLGKLFFDIEALYGFIVKTAMWVDHKTSTQLIQGRLIGGYKLFSHLAVFAGISYDWLLPFGDQAPIPAGAGIDMGWGNDQNIHRIGFFGGIQF